MRLYLIFPFALLLANCSTDEGPPVAAADFCAAWAEAVCGGSSPCCAAQPYPSPKECATAQQAACQMGLEKLLTDPRIGYHPARAGGVIARARTASPTCPLRALGFADLLALSEGTGQATADCTPRDASAAELTLVALSCRREAACRLYLRSSGELQGVCERPSDSACSHPFDCPAGRWCNLPRGWRPGMWGTCQLPRTLGWTCADGAECDSGYCEPMMKTCQPRAAATCGDGGVVPADGGPS